MTRRTSSLVLLAWLVASTANAPAGDRPRKPQGPSYDTVVVKSAKVALRMAGSDQAPTITVRKGDRLELRSLTDEGYVVRLLSGTDWLLPRADGTRDEQYRPKPLTLDQKKKMYLDVKDAQEKARAQASTKEEAAALTDTACLEILRVSEQPTAVVREVMVLGVAQDW